MRRYKFDISKLRHVIYDRHKTCDDDLVKRVLVKLVGDDRLPIDSKTYIVIGHIKLHHFKEAARLYTKIQDVLDNVMTNDTTTRVDTVKVTGDILTINIKDD